MKRLMFLQAIMLIMTEDNYDSRRIMIMTEDSGCLGSTLSVTSSTTVATVAPGPRGRWQMLARATEAGPGAAIVSSVI